MNLETFRTHALLRHRHAGAIGALAALWFVLYFPQLAGLRVLPWDAIDQFYPTVWFNAHSLRAGLAPWWNPYVYGGYPQIADPQGMLFSPLLMGWMLLRADPGTTWFVWGVLLHMLMGAAAMLLLLRRLGGTTFGALMAALVFLGGGVAASRLEHVPMALAYGYAPLVMLLAHVFIRGTRLRHALALGVAAGAMATQLVQLTWLLVLMTAAWVLFTGWRTWSAHGTRARLRVVGGLVLAAVIAAIMALPQLLLTLAFSAVSNRHELPLSAAAPSSITWESFLTFVSPDAFHALRGHYNGDVDQVEGLFYIGAVPVLMLAGLRKAWGRPSMRAPLVFVACVALFALLYMLGLHTPFYGWLYGWLPGLHHFRRPADAAYLLNLSLAVSVGLAASTMDLTDRRAIGWLLAAALLWLMASSAGMHDHDVRCDGRSAIAPLAAGGLWWWNRRRAHAATTVAACLLALCVVDYRAFNLNGALTEAHDNRAAFASDAMARRLAATRPPVRLVTEGIGPGWDNLTLFAGVATTQGYNPLRYQLYDDWYGARDHGALPVPRTPFHPHIGSALDRLAGLNAVLRKGATDPLPAAYTLVATDRDRELWHSDDIYPHFLAPIVVRRETPSPAAFEATDFLDTVYLDPSVRLDEDELRSSARVTSTLQEATYVRTVLRTHAPGGAGWVVASDIDFPGWRATVDGREVPIRRANGMFRAVHVPTGDHELVFWFDPVRLVTSVLEDRRG